MLTEIHKKIRFDRAREMNWSFIFSDKKNLIWMVQTTSNIIGMRSEDVQSHFQNENLEMDPSYCKQCPS